MCTHAAAKPKMKQSTLGFKPKAKKAPAKKGGKKRNPWSSGSESDASFNSDLDDNMDDDFVIPRDTATRRAGKILICLPILPLPLNMSGWWKHEIIFQVKSLQFGTIRLWSNDVSGNNKI